MGFYKWSSKCGTHWVAQVCSPRGFQSVREPVVLCPLPRNSSAGVPPRAELRGGLGGRPRGAPGWFQAWPGVRTLAVSPHPCDLSPICQGPVREIALFSQSPPAPGLPFLCSFSLAQQVSRLKQMQASCFLGPYGAPSTVLYRVQSSEQSSGWTFSSHFTAEGLSQGHAAVIKGKTRARAPGSEACLWHLVCPFASGSFTVSPQHRPHHQILPGHLLLLNGFSCLVTGRVGNWPEDPGQRAFVLTAGGAVGEGDSGRRRLQFLHPRSFEDKGSPGLRSALLCT